MLQQYHHSPCFCIMTSLQLHFSFTSASLRLRSVLAMCSLQAAQLQSLRNSQQMPYSSSTPHVLLELMLLHAQPPGAAGGALNASTQQLYQRAAAPSGFDCSMVLDSSCGLPDGGSGAGGIETAGVNADAAGGAAGSEGDVELLVLVSGMRNMPLVPG
jgi:hypothetical protein